MINIKSLTSIKRQLEKDTLIGKLYLIFSDLAIINFINNFNKEIEEFHNELGQTKVTKKSDGNSENGLLYIVKDISEVNKDTFYKENINPQLQKFKLTVWSNIKFTGKLL